MKLLFEKVNDYDYNNTGQFKCYYMLTTPNRDKFWNGKKFSEWELDILASEGKTIKIVNTIDLHLDWRRQNNDLPRNQFTSMGGVAYHGYFINCYYSTDKVRTAKK
ncbi:hypothetical protein [Streptococcus lutetiensis]|uniref:hypothetical protein n=2 Tax=Streptococcus TaxID=1301 RepID=UPI0015FDC816|nr:hypothetical protein [Streptococcus lutetiensis]